MRIIDNIIQHPKTTIGGIVAGLVMVLAAFGIDVSDAAKQDIITAGAIILPVIIGALSHDPAPQD